MLGTAGEERMNSLGTFFDGLQQIDTPVKTYIHQLCADTECHLEDLPRVINNTDEWREKIKGISALSAHIYIYIYIYIEREREWVRESGGMKERESERESNGQINV